MSKKTGTYHYLLTLVNGNIHEKQALTDEEYYKIKRAIR